ncbi:MAG: hypothetical protein Q7S35_06100, partial [Candidatus Limnocylindrales bacterium]|nr:hypothetical protein [Candidatus Limnocylindrales bacterium]
MPGGIVYLDIDDEITSAATRVRDVPGRRVALVLPYGSRVATSRINFRLLSRDALINEKQLAVVAGDSATRALAASAGLPVFASVGEYESSLAGAGEDRTATAPGAATPPVVATPPAAAQATPTTRARRGPKPKTASAGAEPGAGTDAATAGIAGPAAARGATAPAAGEETAQFEIPRQRRPLEDRPWAEPRPSSAAPASRFPQTQPASRRGSRL